MNSAYMKKLDQIIALLDKEASVIKAGDFDNIGELFEKREILVETVLKGSGKKDLENEEKWREIFFKSERNSRLIQAAMDGVTAVSEIVAAIKSSSTKLNTYNKGGAIADIAVKSTDHERKV